MWNVFEFNESLFNAGADIGRVISPRHNFHSSLANFLYPAAIERERHLLFGVESTCTLYSVERGGEQAFVTLDSYWSARRIPTIESGANEQWRLEITNENVTWKMIQRVATVVIESDTGEGQRYRVVQVENAMKPGHVYALRCEAIEQT